MRVSELEGMGLWTPAEGLKTGYYGVTPAMAEAMLSMGVSCDRRLRPQWVDKIARDIQAGNWRVDGSPIRFDREGNRIDGQHRLHAIVKAGKAVVSAITFGLEPDAFKTIDTGAVRDAAQVLSLAGDTQPAILAATARMAIGYELFGSLHSSRDTSYQISNSELMDYVNEHPVIIESVAAAKTRYSSLSSLTSPTVTAFVNYHLMTRFDSPAIVERFFGLMNDGNSLPMNSPLLAGRQALIRYKTTGVRSQKVVREPSRIVFWNMLAKTWNMWRAGRAVARLALKNTTKMMSFDLS